MRQQYIDILKGLTIVWVLWMHMNMPEILNPAVQMPVFFFISGCFYRKKKTLYEQVKADMYHLLVPTVCFMILAGILMEIRGHHFGGENVVDIIQDCRNGSITWFLIALFCLRLFNYPFEKYKIKKVMFIVGGICYLIGFAWKVYKPDICIPIIPLQEIFMFGIYYIIGALVGKKILEGIQNGGANYVCLIFAVVYILIVHILDWEKGFLSHIPWLVYGFFYTLCFIYMGLVFCWYLQRFRGLMGGISYLGKYSIVFYLTHFLIYGYVFKPLNLNPYFVFTVIVAIEYPLIFVFVKYFPWMIGQKKVKI